MGFAKKKGIQKGIRDQVSAGLAFAIIKSTE